MNNGELLNLIVKHAKEYTKQNVMESIARNKHMNNYGGQPVDKMTSDAIIVDFLNFIGYQHGMDLGLYTSDLSE